MNKECRKCRETMTQKSGSFLHVAFDHRVTLHGVPYWECEHCGHQFYEDPQQVEDKMIEAILMKQTSIEYN